MMRVRFTYSAPSLRSGGRLRAESPAMIPRAFGSPQAAKRLGLEVPLLHVRVGPQGDLHDHRLKPSIVHLVHLLRGVPPALKEGLYGRIYRVDEGDDVTQRYVVQ